MTIISSGRHGCFDTTDQGATLNWVTSLLALDLEDVLFKVSSEDMVWWEGSHEVSIAQGVLLAH